MNTIQVQHLQEWKKRNFVFLKNFLYIHIFFTSDIFLKSMIEFAALAAYSAYWEIHLSDWFRRTRPVFVLANDKLLKYNWMIICI